MKPSFAHKRSESRQILAARHTRSSTGFVTRSSFALEKTKTSESFIVLPKDPNRLLAELKGRKKSKETEVTPEVASAVIKNYLIPMFEADTQARSALARHSVYNTQSSNCFKPDKGTVYAELKLSERLSLKLRQTEEVVENLKRQLAELHQTKFGIQKELDYNRMDLVHAKTSSKVWMLQCEELNKARQISELTNNLFKAQTRELRDTCVSLENQLSQLKQTLHEERAHTENWRNRVVELEHSGAMIKMSNDVMTEHLKGLYEAVADCLNVHSLQDKLSNELSTVVACSKPLLGQDTYLKEQSGFTKLVLDDTQHDLDLSVTMLKETKREKDKLSLVFKEYSTRMEKKSADLAAENQSLQEQYDSLVIKHASLGEEYEKIRQRAKAYHSKKKQFDQVEEKVCKRCLKIYIDTENYNWSCKTHSSEFGGEIYWCCGKAKDGPGCRLAKHENKEDEEEKVEALNREPNKSLGICVGCKKHGHLFIDCPLDPNVVTNADIPIEKSRIGTVKIRTGIPSRIRMT